MTSFDYSPLTALVTGASSGIGAALARLLAQRGIGGLVLVARSRERLEQLAEELRAAHGTRVTVLALDLANPAAPGQLKAETDQRGLQIDLLVNNAGFGSAGPLETLPASREGEMVALNVFAVVALTRAFLPDILARGRGGILSVASTAAFQPTPYMTTYGATKAFVLSFTEALWAEMQDQNRQNIRVCCLCPGSTATEFGQNAGGDRGRFENLPAATAEEVAAVGLHAWERNQPLVIVGRANTFGAFSLRFAPRRFVARMGAALLRPRRVLQPSHRAKAPLRIAVGLLAGATLFSLAHHFRQSHDETNNT